LIQEIVECKEKNGVKMWINRRTPIFPDPQPIHFIHLECHPKCPPMMTVAFFGTVAYHLAVFVTFPEDFFKEIADFAKFPNMIGVQYQGRIDGKFSSCQAFWALGPNGTIKLLNNIDTAAT
jgi:hypothetical protein